MNANKVYSVVLASALGGILAAALVHFLVSPNIWTL